MHMSFRTCLLGLPLLFACRPPPAPKHSEPRGPPPLFVAAGDRLYTAAPVGDGDGFVPVAEKSISRQAGRVAVTVSYPEVTLPDEDRARELATAIRQAGAFDTWLTADGKDLAGTVKITCVTPIATTAVVSLVCERIEATVGADGQPGDLVAATIPAVVARTFDVQASPVRPLAWSDVLLPGLAPRLIVSAALAELTGPAAEAARDAWLSGQCTAGDPGFTVYPTGLDLWPDERTAICPTLALERERMIAFLIPNSLLVRTFRLGGPYAEPTPEAVADPAAAPAP
jgi:hypothetical protein